MLRRFSTQPTYRTDPNAEIWDSEGFAMTYQGSDDPGKQRLTIAELQIAFQLLGAGAARLDYTLGSQGDDTGATFENDPAVKATRLLTRYFPTNRGWQTLQLSSAPGQPRVDASAWTDPGSGRRGSGTRGPDFTFQVPVRTEHAIVVDPATWAPTTVIVKDGHVAVTLRKDDPSPVWMVIE